MAQGEFKRESPVSGPQALKTPTAANSSMQTTDDFQQEARFGGAKTLNMDNKDNSVLPGDIHVRVSNRADLNEGDVYTKESPRDNIDVSLTYNTGSEGKTLKTPVTVNIGDMTSAINRLKSTIVAKIKAVSELIEDVDHMHGKIVKRTIEDDNEVEIVVHVHVRPIKKK